MARCTISSALALAACGFALAGCASSGSGLGEDRDRARAGVPTVLRQTYMTMDERCRPIKRPTARVTEPPRHGSVRMLARQAKAVYGPGPYAHCDGRIGPSLAFEYTSRPDFRGRDAFGVRVRYNDGEIRRGRFDVDVH